MKKRSSTKEKSVLIRTEYLKPYGAVQHRWTTYEEIFANKVEIVRKMPSERLRELIQSRSIYKALGVENLPSLSRSRAIHNILAAAGVVSLNKGAIETMKGIKRGEDVRGRSGNEPIKTILKVAGLVEETRHGGGKITLKVADKKRLEESIREGKIKWK